MRTGVPKQASWQDLFRAYTAPAVCKNGLSTVDNFNKYLATVDLFRDWLQKQDPSFQMKTRNEDSCPIAIFMTELCGEEMCFHSDIKTSDEDAPTSWSIRFARKVDQESSDFVTRDRALELLSQIELEMAGENTSN